MYLMFCVYYEHVNSAVISWKIAANEKHRVYSCLSSCDDPYKIGVALMMQNGDGIEQTICNSGSV